MTRPERLPAALPLPVARLRLRSGNALSAKERHDTAWFALEVSVRLAVAARPPANPRELARASLGTWVAALPAEDRPLTQPALLALYRLLTREGRGRQSAPESVGSRKLLEALAPYRNRVIGHGTARETPYYEEAALVLQAGLEAAWQAGVFLPREARVVWVDTIQIDEGGGRRGHLLDLSGADARLVSPTGDAVPDDVLPRRLYLQGVGPWQPLHPWLLYLPGNEREREALFCFNGYGRGPEYLDYASGESLRGAELEGAFAGLGAELRGLFDRGEEAAEAPEPADQQRFGEYELLGKLGEGGMGVVYLARQENLERLVALKMLPPARAADPTAVARFQREIQALARCEHPNVVKIYASGQRQGTWYYAMEFVQGTDLCQVARDLGSSDSFEGAISSACERAQAEHAELFKDLAELPHIAATPGGPRSSQRSIARFFRDTARGVQHLHEHGVLHRDLKPANLMVTAAEGRAVVMDLGLAAIENSALTLTRDREGILGTLRYVSPEQLQRNLVAVDQRSDIYSLGVSLYELLADRPFFDGDHEARLIEQILREEPRPLGEVAPEVPRDLATIVMAATAKDPRLRYDSAEALADDLEAFLEGRPISRQPPTLAYLLRLAISRNRALTATMAVAVVALIAITAAYIQSLSVALEAEQKVRDARELLADLVDGGAADTVAEEAELYPVTPASAPRMVEWLERVDDQRSREPRHRNDLELARRIGDESLARELEELLAQLELLALLRPRVAERLAEAESLPERTQMHPLWELACTEIASLEAYRQADGRPLELEPQLGLVPLWRNPVSGLWEFAHVLSGTCPTPAQLDAETGAIALEPENGIVLVLLPGDPEFVAGSSDPDILKFPYARNVALAPFFLSRYETTQAQWERIARENPSLYLAGTQEGDHLFELLSPVESVDWNAAGEVGRKLALVVPTEAQWEYGGRAGHPDPYGFDPAEHEVLEFANFADINHLEAGTEGAVDWNDGHDRHAPVGSYRANDFGLHDMHGNVQEWCRDDYLEDPPDSLALGDGLITVPEPFKKIMRGGSWYLAPDLGRSAVRLIAVPTTRNQTIGVRYARTIDS